ncbi:MAG: SPOUT family RNA methylase [Acidilobaceae archaeon]
MGVEVCEPVDIILTTSLDLERVAASYVSEVLPGAVVVASPLGFKGLVVVCRAGSKAEAAEAIRKSVPEVEKVFVVEKEVDADLESIAGAVAELSRSFLKPGESFAVRTVRRGSHSFTSIDVNVAAGAAVKEATGAEVDLEEPDKVFFVNIIGGRAYLSVLKGSEFYKKTGRGKKPLYKFFWRLSLAHEPYLGPLDAAKLMGARVGRAVQSFEVGELVVAPVGAVDAEPLAYFISGVLEGVESRFEVQKRSYGRQVRRVSVRVQDMHQFVRSRVGEPLVIFEPEGEPFSRVSGELAELLLRAFRSGRRVNLMVGARSGVPTGLFRFADYVVDLAPGIVLSTELAASSALTAIASAIHEKLEPGDVES